MLKYKKINIIIENEEVTNINDISITNNLTIEEIIEKKISEDNSISDKRKKDITKLNKEYLEVAFNLVDKDIV